MRRILLPLFAFLVVPDLAAAQEIAVRRLTPREVPAAAARVGKIEAARQWRDRTGDNLLLLTRTDEVWAPDSDGNDARSREIHGYHYVREGGRYRLLWHTVDFERDCIVDIVLQYAPGSLQVTDVDRDGTAETSYVYQIACMGGVDPTGVKLIMHEGATKYAIRGSSDLRDYGGDYPPPTMNVDPALAREPALRAYAVAQWRRFIRTNRWPDEGAP
ncbi:MAG TPA: hypothetical protein VFQ39_03675 [Longimicrobium sp.]|nr:hypothetical protein [Longimicrobium sp.]